jgi:hypothetical protein
MIPSQHPYPHRSRKWPYLSIFSDWQLIYKGVFLLQLVLCSLDGDDVFEQDDLGGRLVDPAFLVGEHEIVGEDDPPSG